MKTITSLDTKAACRDVSYRTVATAILTQLSLSLCLSKRCEVIGEHNHQAS